MHIGKKPKENKKIEITYDSNKKEVEKFLVEKLGLKKETSKKLDLDGETLFFWMKKILMKWMNLAKKKKKNLLKF